MLRRFIFGSGIFALSMLVFSLVRQIIVLPSISRYNDHLFVNLTFMIFTFEAIAYAFTGAIPDYYVKSTNGSQVNRILIKGLANISSISIFSFFAFWALGIGTTTSFLLCLYLYLFSLNALKLKIVFNKLIFSENFIYIGFRSIPYILLLYAVTSHTPLTKGIELDFMALMLLVFEGTYHLRLHAITREKPAPKEVNDAPQIKPTHLLIQILPFIFSSLLIGIIQRGDLTAVKLIDENYYKEYAKQILTVNFFCAPLALMLSAPLLSFIARHQISLHSVDLRKIKIAILFAIIGVSTIASIGFEFVYQKLYSGSEKSNPGIIFILTAMILIYALLRTLAIKYVPTNNLLYANILLIFLFAITALFAPANIFIIIFYFTRMIIYWGMLQKLA